MLKLRPSFDNRIHRAIEASNFRRKTMRDIIKTDDGFFQIENGVFVGLVEKSAKTWSNIGQESVKSWSSSLGQERVAAAPGQHMGGSRMV